MHTKLSILLTTFAAMGCGTDGVASHGDAGPTSDAPPVVDDAATPVPSDGAGPMDLDGGVSPSSDASPGTDAPASPDAAPAAVDAGPPDPARCTRRDLVAQTLCGPGAHCAHTEIRGGVSYDCYWSGRGEQAALCETASECASGFGCFTTGAPGDATAPRVCARYCASNRDCPGGNGTFCAETSSSVQLCTTDCDPTMTGVCPAGTKCDVVDLLGHTTCVVAGARSHGEPCTMHEQCVVGVGCVAGSCRQYCDRAAPTCPAGSRCVGLGPDYGACS